MNPHEILVNELISQACSLGVLDGRGQADSPQYRKTDADMQDTRRRLLDLIAALAAAAGRGDDENGG